ncbi:MAG: hypothetical protein M3Z27_10625 [Actinomycetota bacterium]|nr:hypothetical protein [Actinomycetota bacterium]
MTLGLVAPASAGAFALPSTTDNLQPPAVAVDPSGTAYVAWWDKATSTSSQDQFAVCALPAGASSCAHLTDVPGPVGLTTGPQGYLFIDSLGDPELIINEHNGSAAQSVEHVSTNGGATYTVTNKIGDTTLSSAALDPAIGVLFGASHISIGSPSYDVAGTASELGLTAPPDYVAPFVPLPGGQPTSTASAVSDTASAINVAHAWNSGLSTSAGGASYAYYSGPALKGKSAATVLSNAGSNANWKVGTLSDGGGDLSLAGGPAGIFLSEGNGVGASRLPVIRAFTGSGFGAPFAEECGDTARYGAGLQSSDLFEDPVSGALHYFYIESTGSVTDMRYTELAGGTQSPPVTVAEQGSSGSAIYPRVASNGSGHPGLAVWVNEPSGGSAATVNAGWLPAVALTGCPSTTPPPPGGGKTPPKPVTVTTNLGDQQIALTAPSPSACNPSNSSLAVKLSAKSLAHGKKGSQQKFKQAAFYIDKGVAHKHKVKVAHQKHKFHTVTTYGANAIAKHLPASLHLSLAHLKAGKHTLTVKVSFTHTVRKRHHKLTITSTKNIKVTFTVC